MRDKTTRNLDQVRCTKDEEGQVLVGDPDIKLRRQRYFYKLLNEAGESGMMLGDLEHPEEFRDYDLQKHKNKRGEGGSP